LDVFEQEPLPQEHPFWATKNLQMTFHTSAPSFPEDIAKVFIENYRLYIEGKPLKYQVDFERGRTILASMTVTFTDIQQAAERIKPYAHRTPVMTNESLNQQVGAQVFMKCENLQKVGAFKFRGATNAVFSLTDEEAARGVVTHSSGNHAAALALAARNRGIPAYIVMPSNAPQVKKDAVAGYGGQITFCEPTLQARESTMESIREKTGATVVHPYDNERVIAGQGTAALELLADVPDLDVIITPVGGGGLLSGTSIAAKGLKPASASSRANPKWRMMRSVRCRQEKSFHLKIPKRLRMVCSHHLEI
jgi:threonine dehydratase